MDENSATIPIGFTPLDFLVTLVMPSISQSNIETWDNVVFELAKKAKDRGIRGINEFLLTPGAREEKYGFNVLDINQSVLNKLLKGEIKTLDELRDLKFIGRQNDLPSVYNIFFTEIYNKEVQKYITTIDCIFINS